MEDTKEFAEENTRTRGESGTVGKATPSTRLKQLHAKFGKKYSLKAFAKKLVSEGGDDAKTASDWLEFKTGVLNTDRSESNKTKANMSGSATKASRRGKKSD